MHKRTLALLPLVALSLCIIFPLAHGAFATFSVFPVTDAYMISPFS